jgi:hypothetical protein
MAFACVYVLAQQADPSSAKNVGKERAEAGFRLFWNNINRYWWTTNSFTTNIYPHIQTFLLT